MVRAKQNGNARTSFTENRPAGNSIHVFMKDQFVGVLGFEIAYEMLKQKEGYKKNEAILL